MKIIKLKTIVFFIILISRITSTTDVNQTKIILAEYIKYIDDVIEIYNQKNEFSCEDFDTYEQKRLDIIEQMKYCFQEEKLKDPECIQFIYKNADFEKFQTEDFKLAKLQTENCSQIYTDNKCEFIKQEIDYITQESFDFQKIFTYFFFARNDWGKAKRCFRDNNHVTSEQLNTLKDYRFNLIQDILKNKFCSEESESKFVEIQKNQNYEQKQIPNYLKDYISTDYYKINCNQKSLIFYSFGSDSPTSDYDFSVAIFNDIDLQNEEIKKEVIIENFNEALQFIVQFDKQFTVHCQGMTSEQCLDVNCYPEQNSIFNQVYKVIPNKLDFQDDDKFLDMNTQYVFSDLISICYVQRAYFKNMNKINLNFNYKGNWQKYLQFFGQRTSKLENMTSQCMKYILNSFSVREIDVSVEDKQIKFDQKMEQYEQLFKEAIKDYDLTQLLQENEQAQKPDISLAKCKLEVDKNLQEKFIDQDIRYLQAAAFQFCLQYASEAYLTNGALKFLLYNKQAIKNSECDDENLKFFTVTDLLESANENFAMLLAHVIDLQKFEIKNTNFLQNDEVADKVSKYFHRAIQSLSWPYYQKTLIKKTFSNLPLLNFDIFKESLNRYKDNFISSIKQKESNQNIEVLSNSQFDMVFRIPNDFKVYSIEPFIKFLEYNQNLDIDNEIKKYKIETGETDSDKIAAYKKNLLKIPYKRMISEINFNLKEFQSYTQLTTIEELSNLLLFYYSIILDETIKDYSLMNTIQKQCQEILNQALFNNIDIISRQFKRDEQYFNGNFEEIQQQNFYEKCQKMIKYRYHRLRI